MGNTNRTSDGKRKPKARPEPQPRRERARHDATWKRRATVIAIAMLTLGALALASGAFRSSVQRPQAATVVVPDLDAGERIGESLFARHCSVCHGDNGTGTRAGPPLVHKIYEPSHHSDSAFVRAVRQGVIAHHWRFGNMPALPDVTDQEIKAITRYIRALQRANGIN